MSVGALVTGDCTFCWSARVCTRITNAYTGYIARLAGLCGVGGDATA